MKDGFLVNLCRSGHVYKTEGKLQILVSRSETPRQWSTDSSDTNEMLERNVLTKT